MIDREAIRRNAESLIAEFDIQCGGPDAPMWSLSGGNQQRVVLAREMSNAPVVVVACQPTRGLDVGAIEYMGARLRQAAVDGVGVLLISSELDELMALSDRIIVMYLGKVVEVADKHALYAAPRHPYTRGLIASVPVMHPSRRTRDRSGRRLEGDIPSALNPPSGCRFHTRCPFAKDLCREKEPALAADAGQHQVACHFPLSGGNAV